MKYEYKTASGKTAIEVDGHWNGILLELDRLERNGVKRETRRHASLDAFNLDDALFPSGEDIPADFEASERNAALKAALAELSPEQQALVYRIYFYDEKIIRIAEEQGVSEAAIRDRLKKIKNRLKKSLI